MGTLIVQRQTAFLRNKQLGFDKEHIISLKMVDRFSQMNFQLLKNELLNESTVANAALSSTLPGRQEFYGFPVKVKGENSDSDYSLKTLGVDEDFLATYSIKINEGRDFSKNITADQSEAFILNEAAVEKLGWEEAVGKDLQLTVYTDQGEVRRGKVIGVVENFHYQSLYTKVEPLVIYVNKHPYYSDFLSVKFKPGNVQQSVELLQEKWQIFNPEKPVEYYFLDQELDKLYTNEIKRSRIFSAFALLSIFISCLGLFGLSAFSVQQKTKEIGIRKVLGASVLSIFKLLSKEYLLLVFIANIIAWPLIWYFADIWLMSFAYKVNIEPGVFFLTLVGALVIALATISFQALKVAVINPIETLKDD